MKFSKRLARRTQSYQTLLNDRFMTSMARKAWNKAVVVVAVKDSVDSNRPFSKALEVMGVVEVADKKDNISVSSRPTTFSDSSLVGETPSQTSLMMILDSQAWLVDNRDNNSSSSREAVISNNNSNSKGQEIHSVALVCLTMMTISSGAAVACIKASEDKASAEVVDITCFNRCTLWGLWAVVEAAASSKCRCSRVVQEACLDQARSPRSPSSKMANE